MTDGRVPVTVLTGCLGAGKTTLAAHAAAGCAGGAPLAAPRALSLLRRRRRGRRSLRRRERLGRRSRRALLLRHGAGLRRDLLTS